VLVAVPAISDTAAAKESQLETLIGTYAAATIVVSIYAAWIVGGTRRIEGRLKQSDKCLTRKTHVAQKIAEKTQNVA